MKKWQSNTVSEVLVLYINPSLNTMKAPFKVIAATKIKYVVKYGNNICSGNVAEILNRPFHGRHYDLSQQEISAETDFISDGSAPSGSHAKMAAVKKVFIVLQFDEPQNLVRQML